MEAKNTPTTPTDDEIRDQLLCFFDGDPDAPSAFTTDWHDALKTSSARWTHTETATAA